MALAGCAGGAVPDASIPSLTDSELLREINSAAAVSTEYVRYDSSYRPKLIEELARREKWDDRAKENVTSRRIWIGATERQLIASWGWPRETTEAVRAHGNFATWRYGRFPAACFSVDLANGAVTGWTTHR